MPTFTPGWQARKREAEEIALREAYLLRQEIEACEASLRTFFHKAWPHFDSSPFASNWHLDAIADHLQAVSDGKIKRLLINIPPRFGKTNLVAIAWPVWTWTLVPDPARPLHGPGVRFLCASYGASKAEGDGVTARRLIAHEWFQRRWGERVRIAKDRDNQSQYDNSAGGSRISTGIPESLGKGGAIRLCFPHDQIIQTEAGPLPIGQIVETKRALRVPSLNQRTKQIELKPITAWHRNPAAPLLRLTFDSGLTVQCTPCHRFLIAGGKWEAAAEIPVGTLFPAVRSDQIGRESAPHATGPNVTDGALADAETSRCDAAAFCREKHGFDDLCGDFDLAVALAFAKLPSGGPRAMPARIVDVLGTGAVTKIGEARIAAVAVSMANLLPDRCRPDKGFGDKDVDIDVTGLSVPPQRHPFVSVAGIRARLQHQAALAVSPVAKPFHIAFETANAAGVRDLINREADDRAPDFVRLVKVDRVGQADVTYCLSVADNHSLFCGDSKTYVIASNCDDPHKTDDVESDQVRSAVLRSYDEVWRTRSNDPVNGAEVIVMQRLHESDLSGHVLEEGDPNLVHLMLPMEYDPGRHCHTVLGFSDPRREDGELLWPARFNRNWAERQKKRMGPHAWAGQMNQTPTARGGGIVPADWWRLWPPEGQEDSWTAVADGVPRMLYPDLDYVLVSCDTAYTEKEENDWSACTVWGVFQDEAKNPKIIMLEAWRERLELRALCQKILATARRRRADMLLIEAKASGLSVIQEVRRLMRDGEFSIVGEVPKGDKVARLHAASPAFSAGLVYAPARRWAQMVIDEVASFPRARFKDLTDTVSAGVNKLRSMGLLLHADEAAEERAEELIALGSRSALRRNPREEYGI